MKALHINKIVSIADFYLNDEVNAGNPTTKKATIREIPNDKTGLYLIQYLNGVLDFVPIDVIETN